MKDKKFYLNIIITVVISYILIKFIDNYNYFFEILNLLLSLLTPFVIAFILAYIFNPILNFLENKFKIKRIFSLSITYIILMIIIGLFVLFTFPIIIDSLTDIVGQLPLYANKTQDFILQVGEKLKSIDPNTLKEYVDKIMKSIPEISTLLIGYIGQVFNTTFSITKFIVQLILSFIICFYILLEKEGFIDFSKKVLFVLVGNKYANFLLNIGSALNKNIGKYFVGKLLDSLIVGVLSTIGLFLLKSKYALLFGILMFFFNLIPYFGPVLGMAPVFIINLFYNQSIAIFSLAYLLLVQQIEIAVIEPKIVGNQLGISPFLTILAVTIGGGFFGIPGMILSVPIMGVIKVYFIEYINFKHKNMIDKL